MITGDVMIRAEKRVVAYGVLKAAIKELQETIKKAQVELEKK